MKGTLRRTPKEWVVRYFDTAKAHDIMYCGESLPIHPENAIPVVIDMDNMEIEFEIVNESWDGYMGGTYAKLINKKSEPDQILDDDLPATIKQ